MIECQNNNKVTIIIKKYNIRVQEPNVMLCCKVATCDFKIDLTSQIVASNVSVL